MSHPRCSACVVALLAWILAGCATPSTPAGPASNTTAAPISTVDPHRALAQLNPVGTLQEAARECARVLGGTPDAVRVKVDEPPQAGQCTSCALPPAGYVDKGRPLDEVALPLIRGSSVWLTIGDVICAYYFDGGAFKPSAILFW